jgi:hypothetical protein
VNRLALTQVWSHNNWYVATVMMRKIHDHEGCKHDDAALEQSVQPRPAHLRNQGAFCLMAAKWMPWWFALLLFGRAKAISTDKKFIS